MISFELFLVGLLGTSIFTGLVTEAVKIVMVENGKTYLANTLAGIVAIVVAAAISAAYIGITGIALNSQVIVCIVALMVMGWLCAMVGYDKVIQAISQFKTHRKDDNK